MALAVLTLDIQSVLEKGSGIEGHQINKILTPHKFKIKIKHSLPLLLKHRMRCLVKKRQNEK